MGVMMKRRFTLLEADDDNNETGGTQANGGDTTTDNAGDGNQTDNTATNDNNTDTKNQENQDDQGEIDGDQQNDEENNDDNNFDIDAEENQEEEGDDNNDNDDTDGNDATDDNDDTDDTGADTDMDSDEKQLDRDMFETLSDTEKKQKIITLKKLFLEMYNTCDSIIDRYNHIVDRFENVSQIGKRVIMTLYDMKKYISDYTINIFDTKSYIENDIMYNRCLSVLNGIKMVTKDVAKLVEEDKKKTSS